MIFTHFIASLEIPSTPIVRTQSPKASSRLNIKRTINKVCNQTKVGSMWKAGGGRGREIRSMNIEINLEQKLLRSMDKLVLLLIVALLEIAVLISLFT